jgi:hypothetical protein
MVESGAFLGIESGEELVLNEAESDEGDGECIFACRRELDDMTPTVSRISLARDQPAFLELVQKPDNVAGIETQDLAENLLTQGSPFTQNAERVEVTGPEPTWSHGCLRGSSTKASQVVEQGERSVVHPGRCLHHAQSLHLG